MTRYSYSKDVLILGLANFQNVLASLLVVKPSFQVLLNVPLFYSNGDKVIELLHKEFN